MVGTVPFANRTFAIAHKYVSGEVHGLNGAECPDPECKEILFDRNDDSAERYSKALEKAMDQYRGTEMRRIRKKLGMTQKEMILLVSGAGHNAVSRYENGITRIPTPLWLLLVLLDKKPELVKELSMQI